MTRTRKFAGVLAEVNLGNTHLGIYLSSWSGLETYSLEGRELFRVRSLALSGTRRIPLPDGRVAEVDVSFFPLWTARLLVDGSVAVANLFPHLRLWQMVMVGSAVAGIVLSLLAFAFILPVR